jgi:hypothetical protein
MPGEVRMVLSSAARAAGLELPKGRSPKPPVRWGVRRADSWRPDAGWLRTTPEGRSSGHFWRPDAICGRRLQPLLSHWISVATADAEEQTERIVAPFKAMLREIFD